MGRVRTCIGKYATTPYTIEQLDLRIYSMEELCYYICNQAFLLDIEFMSADLAEWIDAQLGLSELAKTLRMLIRNGNSLESFVSEILDAAYFCDLTEKNEILKVIRENARLNVYEKRKKRIDHLASTGSYEQAMQEYEKLLYSVLGKDLALTGSVYMAMGKIAARMFYFVLAEELFEKAYKLTYWKESMLYYVCTVKMHGTKEEQRQKLSAKQELRTLEPEADQLLERLEREWEMSESGEILTEMKQMWENGKPAEYYELVERTTDQLKEEYRKQARMS